MAVLETPCGGDCWQADFAPLVPRLERIFRRYFWHWSDRDEVVHNAVLLFMETFAARWQQGTTLRLTTNFTVRAVRQGLRFMRRGNGGPHAVRSVPALSNRGELLARIRGQIQRKESWADFHLLLGEIPRHEATAVRMAVQGWRINQIATRLSLDWHRVRSILLDAAELLS